MDSVDAYYVRDWTHALDALSRGVDPPGIAWQLEPELFPRWCELVRRSGNMVAIVDEAHDCCAPQRVPPEFLRLVRRTRHSRVDLVLVAQRPTGIDPSVRSQAHAVTSFSMQEPKDLEWLGGACGPEFRSKVQALRKHQSAKWDA